MSTISASTTSTTAYKVTADTTGTLVLQTGSTPTTAVTIGTDQNITTTGNIRLNNGVADGAQLILASSGFSDWNIDNFSGRFRWYYNTTEYMTLDASGNLGVGTSSPNARLHLNTSGSSVGLTLQCSGGYGYVFNDGTYVSLASDIGSTGLKFRVARAAPDNAATIDSSGNLLVGTTSSVPAADGISCYAQAGNYQIIVGHSSSTSSGVSFVNFRYNNGSIGSITQNGTTGVLYNLTSDYRLKNNPAPVTGAKEFIMALQPKTWDWWDGSGKGVGFIAHEFMEIAQYSGHGEKDAVDENGNPVYQSIQPSSSEVMANLVAHIQELETRLAALENK